MISVRQVKWEINFILYLTLQSCIDRETQGGQGLGAQEEANLPQQI